MNRTSFNLLTLLLLCTLLTACGGEEGETLTALNPADWPTPIPAQAQATTTPFPKDALATLITPTATPDTNTDDPLVTETDGTESATTTEAAESEVTETGATETEATGSEATETEATETEATETEATETSTNVSGIKAIVSSYGLNLRVGPGAGFAIIKELPQGDEVTVIAQAYGGAWVQLQTAQNEIGWVNTPFLTMDGSLRDVPTEAQASTTSQSTSAASGAETQTSTETENSTSSGSVATATPAPAASGATTASTTTSTSAGNSSVDANHPLLLQAQSGGQVFIINRDGSNLRPLTWGIDPVLSPAGSQVAFTRWGGNDEGSLWVINTDGTGERKIVGDIKQIKSPSWSPDGTQVAINFQDGGRLNSVRECRNTADGEPDINFWQAYDIETEISFDENGVPTVLLCWSLPPDPHWQLRIINVTTGHYQDMPAGQYAFAPTWDPINTWRVVSTAGQGLVATDVNQGTAQPLTNDPSDRAPIFSPDGKYIVVTYRQHDHWEVHRLNADGTGRVRLTKTPLYAIVDGPKQVNNAAPTFSPDSTEIAFLTDRTGQWEVWVMNLDGSNQRPMFSNQINQQLDIQYTGNDARLLRWGR